MEIRTLYRFLVVAREENITRAAENLHIAQPSLSKQIMDLEEEIGKKLFIRGKRKVTLTEDGIFLKKRAEELIDMYDKIEKEIKADDQEVVGCVSIGGLITQEVLKIASSIRKSHPNIIFDFYVNEATEIIERLDHGLLDFVILPGSIDTMKYETLSLRDEYRWGVLMSNDCELADKQYITSEDLQSIPLIFHKRAGIQRVISMWANYEIESLNIVATYNITNGNIEDFVNSGLGYLLITENLVPNRLENVCFKPLYPSLKMQYSLAWKRHTTFNKASKYFINEMKNKYRS